MFSIKLFLLLITVFQINHFTISTKFDFNETLVEKFDDSVDCLCNIAKMFFPTGTLTAIIVSGLHPNNLDVPKTTFHVLAQRFMSEELWSIRMRRIKSYNNKVSIKKKKNQHNLKIN